jgi:hypothetical protein
VCFVLFVHYLEFQGEQKKQGKDIPCRILYLAFKNGFVCGCCGCGGTLAT